VGPRHMLWNATSRYVAPGSTSDARDHHDHQRRKLKTVPASPTVHTVAARTLSRRIATDVPQRLFSTGQISPVLDSSDHPQAQLHARASPHAASASGDHAARSGAEPPPRSQSTHSLRRLQAMVGLQGVNDSPRPAGERQAERPVSGLRDRPPRQDRALGTPPAPSPAPLPGGGHSSSSGGGRDAVPRAPQFRSKWPNLEIASKDVACMQNWYHSIETTLSSSFPDSRCAYTWLDPIMHGPRAEQLIAPLESPFTFQDFKEGWDFADLSHYTAWCQERIQCRKDQKENVNTANEDRSVLAPKATEALIKEVAAGIEQQRSDKSEESKAYDCWRPGATRLAQRPSPMSAAVRVQVGGGDAAFGVRQVHVVHNAAAATAPRSFTPQKTLRRCQSAR